MMRIKKLIPVFAFIVIAFFSCNNPFPNYVEKSEGIYFKLLSFEEEESYQTNRYVLADVKILKENEIIFRQYKEQIFPPKHELAFLFNELNKGDSAEFKVSSKILSNEFPLLITKKQEEEFITIYIKVYDYLSAIKKHEDPEMLEQLLLKKYLKENNISKQKNGVFIQQIKKGQGESLVRGKEVTIHYKGKYLNQIEFDNTYNKSSLTFTYGTPGQVIKGLEIALKGMKNGEKSKIIIPSQLAFGDEGSSTQVIPSFTTVIYELEIVKIK